MMKITVVAPNLARSRDAIGRFAKGLSPQFLQNEFNQLANDSLVVIRNEAPVNKDPRPQSQPSGTLRNSIIMILNGLSVEFVDTAWYSKFVREGTAPHWVVAGEQTSNLPSWVNVSHGFNQSSAYGSNRGWPKKFLAWPGSSGYIPYVYQNKGITANKYDERAADAVEAVVETFSQHIAAQIDATLTGF